MPDPQRPGAVTGYTEQPQELINLVNRIKAKENELGQLFEELEANIHVEEHALELGRNRLREGFMWTIRAVFQPESKL